MGMIIIYGGPSGANFDACVDLSCARHRDGRGCVNRREPDGKRTKKRHAALSGRRGVVEQIDVQGFLKSPAKTFTRSPGVT